MPKLTPFTLADLRAATDHHIGCLDAHIQPDPDHGFAIVVDAPKIGAVMVAVVQACWARREDVDAAADALDDAAQIAADMRIQQQSGTSVAVRFLGWQIATDEQLAAMLDDPDDAAAIAEITAAHPHLAYLADDDMLAIAPEHRAVADHAIAQTVAAFGTLARLGVCSTLPPSTCSAAWLMRG